MIYESRENRRDYAPPLLGNGEIAVQLDALGQTVYMPKDPIEEGDVRVYASPFVWWEGRRYVYDIRRFLIPFGMLTAEIEGFEGLGSWKQELDPVRAVMKGECVAEGARVVTEAFVHHDRNLLCIRRSFYGTEGKKLQLGLRLTDNKADAPEKLPRYMTVEEGIDHVTGGLRIGYTVFGQRDYEGVIRIFTDVPSEANREGTLFTLNCPAEGTVTWYMLLRDDLNEPDYEENSRRQAEEALHLGFDGLLKEHTAAWKRFADESRVEPADPALKAVYEAARYDMGCYVSRWSIPVGISDLTWEGKYFAYDEYFSYTGLLTGGHSGLARRVPEFRRAGLEQAVSRMSSAGKREARYFWETVETGGDATIPGFWNDHVFHMANISVGAWEYYAYTWDEKYLRETAWPMIRACAEFYLRHMVYVNHEGKTIIGKCTDWERLGSSVENAYATTCGAIKTLKVAARAARILGEEPEFVIEALSTADALKAGLAVEEGRYVPHPGCEQRSIGVFAGLFPYDVIPREDPFQRSAIEDYRRHEHRYGNMYATGSGVSAWFAGWMCIAYARLLQPKDAWGCLKRAVETAGCFGEMFEINEPRKYYRPWFTTANGIVQAAVHNMLVISNEEAIELFPGWPAEAGDVSFTLPAMGDMIVEAEMKDGMPYLHRVIGGSRCSQKQVRVRFPDGKEKIVPVE